MLGVTPSIASRGDHDKSQMTNNRFRLALWVWRWQLAGSVLRHAHSGETSSRYSVCSSLAIGDSPQGVAVSLLALLQSVIRQLLHRYAETPRRPSVLLLAPDSWLPTLEFQCRRSLTSPAICHLSFVICHPKTGYWLFAAGCSLDLLYPSASFRSSRGTRSSIG